MRYFIEVSYKGTNLHGWQRQNNAPSVQGELERAMLLIMRTNIEITGSSRTDTGVHAEQQFGHFDIDYELTNIGKTVHNINSILTNDVVLKQIIPVKATAHSRFDATHRCYEYRIIHAHNPFLQQMAFVHRFVPNLVLMNESAKLLTQYTDFECFSKVHTAVKTFDCNIEYAFWEYRNKQLIFNIKANRFLRGMVRAIVGTLLEIGQGRRSIEDFEQLILSKNRKNAASQAPAHGLFLTEVGYTDGYFEINTKESLL
jgi:tRNA pseudouridine38-40 synthase